MAIELLSLVVACEPRGQNRGLLGDNGDCVPAPKGRNNPQLICILLYFMPLRSLRNGREWRVSRLPIRGQRGRGNELSGVRSCSK